MQQGLWISALVYKKISILGGQSDHDSAFGSAICIRLHSPSYRATEVGGASHPTGNAAPVSGSVALLQWCPSGGRLLANLQRTTERRVLWFLTSIWNRKMKIGLFSEANGGETQAAAGGLVRC